MSETVVCVHGFWSHGAGMYLIKRRLEKEYDFRGLLFNYPSVRGSLDDNADRLADFIHDQQLEAAHLVGHSLGGIIALRMLANESTVTPGRCDAPMSWLRQPAGRGSSAYDGVEKRVSSEKARPLSP